MQSVIRMLAEEAGNFEIEATIGDLGDIQMKSGDQESMATMSFTDGQLQTFQCRSVELRQAKSSMRTGTPA